jgi:hypothetical protein
VIKVLKKIIIQIKKYFTKYNIMLSIPAKSNLYEHLLSRSGQMMADDGR